MGVFAELFPGRKLVRVSRDEDSNGQDPGLHLPEGPLDLDSGVLRLERRSTDRRPEPEDPADRSDHPS